MPRRMLGDESSGMALGNADRTRGKGGCVEKRWVVDIWALWEPLLVAPYGSRGVVVPMMVLRGVNARRWAVSRWRRTLRHVGVW